MTYTTLFAAWAHQFRPRLAKAGNYVRSARHPYTEQPWRCLEGFSVTAVAKSTLDIDQMLFQYWPSVCDAGPAWKQYWVNVSYLLHEKRSDVIKRVAITSAGSINQLAWRFTPRTILQQKQLSMLWGGGGGGVIHNKWRLPRSNLSNFKRHIQLSNFTCKRFFNVSETLV